MAGIPFGINPRALRIQGGVVGALILREIKTRFGSSGVGWIWLLFEPIVQCLAYVVIYEIIRTRVSPLRGIDVAEFMLSGIVPWLFYMRAATQVEHSIETNRALLVYPQVTPLDIAIARTLLEFMIMCVVLVFLVVLKWFVLGNADVYDPIGFLMNCAALAIMGFGVGLAMMSVGHFFPLLSLLAGYINRLLYFTSGIFFTLSAVPANYRPYVDWNPLLQAIEAARACYFSTLASEPLNPAMLAFAVPGIAALGVLAERATRGIAKKVSTS